MSNKSTKIGQITQLTDKPMPASLNNYRIADGDGKYVLIDQFTGAKISLQETSERLTDAENELSYIKAMFGAVGNQSASDVAEKFLGDYEKLSELRDPTPYALITVERIRQNAKWGVQTHLASVWACIAGEEMGEVHQAVLHDEFGGRAKWTLRTEIVHLAAVCVQWLEALDREGYEGKYE